MAKKSKKKQETPAQEFPKQEPETLNQAQEQSEESPKDDSPPPSSQVESSPKVVEKQSPSNNDSAHQEIGKLRAQLEAAENERDDVQEQYDELLEKVSHIKTTLGQRLKSDAAELAKIKEELESQTQASESLKTANKTLETENKEIKEKYDKDHAQLGYIELQLGEEKEKSQTLESRVTQLTQDVEQQSSYAEHYRKSHQETVSSSQKLEKDLKDKAKAAESNAADTKSKLEAAQSENAQLQQKIEQLTLERDQHSSKAAGVEELNETIREKNILIGKLRHEAVILNEHLTNALRIVKKDSDGKTVDKELISNLIVQFVTIPRGDTKKFEVLQLISSFLNWDESRRVEVGISRSQQGGERSLGGFLGKFAEFMERESRKS